MPSKFRVSVNLAEREHQELLEMAEKYRVSIAWLGRQAIYEYLERHSDDDPQLPVSEQKESYK